MEQNVGIVMASPGTRPTVQAVQISRAQAGVAGSASAAVALGVGELVSAFGGPEQSLVGEVGTAFINRFAGPLKNIAVTLFGTNDKAALVVGIVVVSLAVGAFVGIATRTWPWFAPAGFAAFALLGVVAGWSDNQVSQLLAVFAALAGAAAGVLTLRFLFGIASGSRTGITTHRSARVDVPTNPAATRRSFFGWAGAASAFAVASAGGAHAINARSTVETARRAVKLPDIAGSTPGLATSTTTENGIEGLSPYLVANRDFYRIDTALVVPQVEPSTWRLRITGMVDNPFEVGFDELLALAQVEEIVTISCVSNEIGGDLVGNARWQGVPLKTLLDRAGVQSGATQIVGRSIDGWTAGFPTELALDGRTSLVAVGMNGEPLPVIHGFPARLIVAGIYGYVSATKWLSEIQLTTWEGFDGYWIPRGWSKTGPIKTSSRIDVPSDGASLRSGPTPIAGVAWAPTRGIAAVEVQVDEQPWRTARLVDASRTNTWTQWVLEWNATPGEHTLRVRATDGTGETQTSKVAPPAPDGVTGWHTRQVTVD